METDSCEPRRGREELLWKTEHLGPALAMSSWERGQAGPSYSLTSSLPAAASGPRAVLLFLPVPLPSTPIILLGLQNAARDGVWAPLIKGFEVPPGSR